MRSVDGRTLVAMRVRTTHRLAAVAGPALVAALVLGACGGGGSEAESRTTVKLTAGDTDYQTIAPATTTIVPAAGGTTPGEPVNEYTIVSGDYPNGLATKLGVSVDDLAAINEWAGCSASGCASFPGPGTKIKVPPGGTAPAVSNSVPAATGDSGSTDAAGTTGTDSATPPSGDTIPDSNVNGDGCTPGSHVVKDGDYPGKLVKLYDVTLDALNQANADNPAYQRFIPGDKIVIPPKSGC